ncbi:MAG: hypothetical protein ACREHC_01570 [Candidatus Levyibacteriota bacterium]
MNGHTIATNLGQVTGAIIALVVFVPIVFLCVGFFKFLFKLVCVIAAVPFKILFSIVKFIFTLFKQKRNTQQTTHYKEQKPRAVQQRMIESSDYIGLLTKIDKKQIAEDYLKEQRRNKNGRKN